MKNHKYDNVPTGGASGFLRDRPPVVTGFPEASSEASSERPWPGYPHMDAISPARPRPCTHAPRAQDRCSSSALACARNPWW